MPVKHYEVLNNHPSKFTVKVNPAAYSISIFKGQVPQGAVLAFNANYSWLGVPIGRVTYQCKQLLPYIPTLLDERPVLSIDNVGHVAIETPCLIEEKGSVPYVSVQAGPMLVREGRSFVHQSVAIGQFKSDAIRRTTHLSAGVTAAGKLIVAYTEDMSLAEIAAYLIDYGCMSAMKMDGGHQSMLFFMEKPGVFLRFGNQGKVPVGIALSEKSR